MGRFLGVDFPESVEENRGQKRGVFPSPKHGFVATFCAISGQKILESVEENRGQKKSSKKVRFFVKIAFWRFSGLEGFGVENGVQNRVLGSKTGFWGSPEAVLFIFLRDLGSKTASGSSKRRPPVRPPKKLPKGFTVDNLGPFRGFGTVFGGSGGGFIHISQGFGVQNRLWSVRNTVLDGFRGSGTSETRFWTVLGVSGRPKRGFGGSRGVLENGVENGSNFEQNLSKF